MNYSYHGRVDGDGQQTTKQSSPNIPQQETGIIDQLSEKPDANVSNENQPNKQGFKVTQDIIKVNVIEYNK